MGGEQVGVGGVGKGAFHGRRVGGIHGFAEGAQEFIESPADFLPAEEPEERSAVFVQLLVGGDECRHRLGMVHLHE